MDTEKDGTSMMRQKQGSGVTKVPKAEDETYNLILQNPEKYSNQEIISWNQ